VAPPPNDLIRYRYEKAALPYADCPLPGAAGYPSFRARLGDRADSFVDRSRPLLDGVVYAGDGRDFLEVPGGVAYGGPGSDSITARVGFGGTGRDSFPHEFLGFAGDHQRRLLRGGPGADDLTGAGNLDGGPGDDTLEGLGTLRGGSGADEFDDYGPPGRRVILAQDSQYDVVVCRENSRYRVVLDGRDYITPSCLSGRIIRSRAARAVARDATHVYRGRGWKVGVACPADVVDVCAGTVSLLSPGPSGPSARFRIKAGIGYAFGFRVGDARYCAAAATKRLLVRVRSKDASGVWRSATRALDPRPLTVPETCSPD
jgi:hypothetical protein